MGKMNEFTVLDPNGHSRTTWDPGDPEAVETARRLFERLTRGGFRAFRMDRDAGHGAPQSTFDPSERETVFIPPIRAG